MTQPSDNQGHLLVYGFAQTFTSLPGNWSIFPDMLVRVRQVVV